MNVIIFLYLGVVLCNNLSISYSIGGPKGLRSSSTCKYYKVKQGDTCSRISKSYSITVEKLEEYNKDNYNWQGCNNLQIDYLVCVSSGSYPKPVSNPLAECGPFAPGALFDTKCPLNACCSQYGFCGLTSEFCENKCYSNCNYGKLGSGGGSDNIAYWIDTDGALKYDIKQLNGKYNTVHYAFVDIKPDFSIDDSKFSKSGFMSISPKKVVSFGGWEFSTNPSTYNIFREGVSSSNREKLASNIVSFANKYNLDGVDLDWEYPGAPDIPGIAADSKSSGRNYLAFVKLLKSKMGGKTVSMAIPSSYWYLKNYPLKEIEKYVDYFVFMTYDLYGVWDLDKDNTIKCHVNKTGITDSMKMLNKAGIDFSKTYAGIANYGRSYKASSSGCVKEGCKFSGPGNKREKTNTAGVLSIEEIKSIKGDSWIEPVSKCNFKKYDGDSIVGWSEDLGGMSSFIQQSGFKGSVLWASNYYGGSSEDEDGDYEVVDEYLYNIEKEEIEFVGNKYNNVELTFEKLTKCNKDPSTIIVETETNDYCIFTGMVFNLLGPLYSSLDELQNFIGGSEKEKFKKDYNLYVENVQLSLWDSFNNWLGYDTSYDQGKGDGMKYYDCKEKDNVCVITTCTPFMEKLCQLGMMDFHIKSIRLKENSRDEAAKSLSDFLDMSIISTDFKVSSKKVGYNVYRNCEFVDFGLVFVNPLDKIDKEYLFNMQNIIDSVNKEYKESPIESYYALKPLVALAESYDTIKTVAEEAKKIRKQNKANRIMSIIGFVFMGLSILAMPFGVAVNLAVDTASLIASIVTDLKLNGKIDGESLAFGLVSIISPFVKTPGVKVKDAFKSFDLPSIRKNNDKFKRTKEYDSFLTKKYCKK